MIKSFFLRKFGLEWLLYVYLTTSSKCNQTYKLVECYTLVIMGSV
jgi:hypothetical protein